MRYLFDTSALLAHYRQETGWEQVQALFEQEDVTLYLCVLSLPEFGRRLLPVDERIAYTALDIGRATPRTSAADGRSDRRSGGAGRGHPRSPRPALERRAGATGGAA